MKIKDWDAAYSNRDAVPEHPEIFERYATGAAAFRASAAAELDLPYGPAPRSRYDYFKAEGSPKGALVFIHGGYWMAFDKNAFSHMAAGPVKRGWDVLIPSYDLCPAVSLDQIAGQIGAFVEHVIDRHDGDLVLSGHSAGGQLAALMACHEGPLPESATARISKVVGISGLYDLRPLLKTKLNQTLGMDPALACRNSPALLTPIDRLSLTAWCGGSELPEFRRQNGLIANIWDGFDCDIDWREAEDRDHFTVIEDISDPESALCTALTMP